MTHSRAKKKKKAWTNREGMYSVSPEIFHFRVCGKVSFSMEFAQDEDMPLLFPLASLWGTDL